MEINNSKTKTVRELGSVDISRIISKLPLLFKNWDRESEYAVNHNKSTSLAQVNHINFRWSDKNKEPVEYVSLPLWEDYKDILLPLLREAVKPIGYKEGYFPRVMLARMLPGTVIPEHIDGRTKGWIAHKIHIPLITNPSAVFFVEGQKYLITEYLDASINDVPYSDL